MSPLPLFLLSALAAPQNEASSSPWEALAQGETVTVEQVLFILNEEMVTLHMVEEAAARLLKQPRPPASVEEAMSRSLADLVFNLIALEGFRRFGLDESLLEEQVTQQMNFRIESYGSRARLEEALLADGYTLLSYRDFLRAQVIRILWRNVVTGQQPSPLQGFRSRLDVTPADIRDEFERDPKRWEQGFSLVWKVLQFHDNSTGSGLIRAEAIATALRKGSMSLREAEAAAQSSQEYRGDPAERSLRPEIRSFLLGATVGQVSAVEPIPSLGGLIFVVTERSPARTIGFAEAQSRISIELRERREAMIVAGAAEELIRTSYHWYPSQLEDFMSSLLHQPANPRETEF